MWKGVGGSIRVPFLKVSMGLAMLLSMPFVNGNSVTSDGTEYQQMTVQGNRGVVTGSSVLPCDALSREAPHMNRWWNGGR